MPSAAASLIICGIAIALYLAYQWALPKPIPGIPYDRNAATSLMGNMPGILAHGDIRSWLVTEVMKHKAPLVQFWASPLRKPILILTDYQEAQDIIVRRTKEFDRSQRAADIFSSVVPEHHIAMITKDPRFKGNKELVRDLMAPSFLHDVSAPHIYSKTTKLIDLWTLKSDAANGRPFEASKDLYLVALDIINAAAFSFDDSMSTIKHQLDGLEDAKDTQTINTSDGSVNFVHGPDSANTVLIQTLTGHLGTQSKTPFPRLNHRLLMLLSPKLRQAFAQKKEMISSVIEKSLRRFEAGDTSMFSATDHLLHRETNAAAKAGREPDFHSPRLHDELFGYHIGGHETSSTSLAWLVKLLADNQESQQRLRSALQYAYPIARKEKRHPSCAEITGIAVPYLDAFIEESLRLASPLPILTRTAYEDTTILGRKVPKGTLVMIITSGPEFRTPPFSVDDALRSDTSRVKHWGGQWNPEDIHCFKPERWLKTDDNGNVTYNPYAGPILAFGLGPRSCFGKRLAYLELKMVLAMLVWNFDFKELGQPFNSYDLSLSITTAPKYCYVNLEKHQ